MKNNKCSVYLGVLLTGVVAWIFSSFVSKYSTISSWPYADARCKQDLPPCHLNHKSHLLCLLGGMQIQSILLYFQPQIDTKDTQKQIHGITMDRLPAVEIVDYGVPSNLQVSMVLSSRAALITAYLITMGQVPATFSQLLDNSNIALLRCSHQFYHDSL